MWNTALFPHESGEPTLSKQILSSNYNRREEECPAVAAQSFLRGVMKSKRDVCFQRKRQVHTRVDN